jgi:hypothetical protein
LWVHIVGNFSSFFYSFDPPNLGTTQQIGYSNRSTHF